MAVFIVVSAVLGFVDQAAQQEAAKRAETERVESTQRIIERGQDATRNNDTTPDGESKRQEFTGRYRMGPDPAPIRLVLFTDYQCPDCAKVESEVSAVLASRDDVSLSIKHFPFCPDCNKYLARNIHPNACLAALAAEAAGALGGDKAFFAMHHWLFARHGMFTDQQLDEGAASLGLDPAVLRKKMADPSLMATIRADVDEGVALGLHLTPMVFVNGVEFRGWQTQGALTRMIEEVAASNPPALGPDADNPVRAYEKFMEDWRRQPVRRMPPDGHPRAIGRENASARVVVFGDYADQFTAGVDRNLRSAVAAGVDLRYTFRHYPLDQAINPAARATVHPGVGLAHRAAEAAGKLGGQQAYWAMHTWLMANQGKVDAGALSTVAAQLDLSADAFTAALSSPEVRNAVIEDARAAQRLDINAIPMIFVNGKRVPRWRLEGRHVLQDIIKEAMEAD
jgi:protein-disulfide isomerase